MSEIQTMTRLRPETRVALVAIAERQGWTITEAAHRAVNALKEKLDSATVEDIERSLSASQAPESGGSEGSEVGSGKEPGSATEPTPESSQDTQSGASGNH